jgi:environmental stress-induced protein Ves
MTALLLPGRYRQMPWANGKGVTVEMLRLDGPEGMLLRLSRASVVEDGDFSLLAGVERNLTVITGPGFDLVGEGIALQARPLVPVAFAGDVAVKAAGVTAPSDDFNVMTARVLPRPRVEVLSAGQQMGGKWLVAYALAAARASGRDLPERGLLVAEGMIRIEAGGPALVVSLAGLPEDQMRKIG